MVNFFKTFLVGFILFFTLGFSLPGVVVGQGLTCSGDFQQVNGICVPKPKGTGLGASKDFVGLMNNVFKILLGISGAIAVLLVLVGGFKYMTSAGNEKQAESGKNTVVYALIGLIVVILAYTIVNVVVRFVTA